ncbi:MAG TPA: nucleoside 2-deoxyribosyltransferase [Candidatus Doudnabacteria bacterium]|nr:nucleoside 2-deoxyribosyltransferase [Candidatus Doudnabacteria bacterium]
MKIYFAGSITGGREDYQIYIEIIEILGKFGSVSTEHIGDENLLDTGESLNVEEIFRRDIRWLEESDVIVAEVTTISMGVGYELGISEKLGKKVICLYRPDPLKRISAMILGNTNFSIYPYQNVEEIVPILEKELS